MNPKNSHKHWSKNWGLDTPLIQCGVKHRWYPGTVLYILDNPKYRGQLEYFFRFQEEHVQVIREGEHEGIVGE